MPLCMAQRRIGGRKAGEARWHHRLLGINTVRARRHGRRAWRHKQRQQRGAVGSIRAAAARMPKS